MTSAAQAVILLVALLHAYFLVLEMFLWRTRAKRLFRMSDVKAEMTAELAGNQGLYNGFLSAGLVWALFSPHDFAPRAAFFLICVVVAGAYGAWSVDRKIFFIQGVPALLALILLGLSSR
jgi:putative membrane protein